MRAICTLASVLVLTLPTAAADKSGFAGTWEGTTNDLPSVELTLQDTDSGVGGVIGFYFQTRGADGKWRLGPKSTGELLTPKLDGRVLTFETLHHKKHGSPELGPNNKYRVKFVSAKEARLQQIVNQETKADDSGLKLTRRE